MKENLDKGWAWVILTVIFLSRLSIATITFSTGVMNIALLEYFERSVAATSIFGAVFFFSLYSIGPVASLIINRFGCRVAHVIGTSLSFVGFFCGFFVTSLEAFIFTYGLLGGAGIGIIYVNDIVILSFHFKKYLGLSVGLTNAGGGLGVFVCGPWIQYNLDTYGLSGACLVVSGIFLHEVVFGSLMFPSYGERMNIIVETPSQTDTADMDIIVENPTKAAKVDDRHAVKINQDGKNAVNNDQTLSKIPADEENFKNSNENEIEKERPSPCCEILQFDIFKNKAYVVLLICDFLWTIPYAILTYHLPNFTVKLGSTHEEAAFLLTAMGTGGTINRFLTGLSLGPGGLDPLLLFLGFNGILGALTLTYPLYFTPYITHLMYAFLFGMYTGGLVTMKNLLYMDIVGRHFLSTAVGLSHLLEGVAYLSGPPIAGLIYDITGSYEYTFYLSGTLFISTFLLSLLASVWREEKKTTIGDNLESCVQTDSTLETISENVSSNGPTASQNAISSNGPTAAPNICSESPTAAKTGETVKWEQSKIKF